MTNPPENWQAIALIVEKELNALIHTLIQKREYIMSAVERNHYALFRQELEELAEGIHDRPKPESE